METRLLTSLRSEFYLTEHRLGWAERERLTQPLRLILHIMSGPGHGRAPAERLVRCRVLTWINFIEGSQSWNVHGKKKSLITQITQETDSCRQASGPHLTLCCSIWLLIFSFIYFFAPHPTGYLHKTLKLPQPKGGGGFIVAVFIFIAQFKS